MSRKKYLIGSLESCEKHEFDEVVKSYLREAYGFKSFAVTDGKDDTGIDIKIFDLNAQKIQIQLTTQKSETKTEKKLFEKKLFEDVAKAKINADSFGYLNSLFFFYSKKLTNKVIRDYEKRALSLGVNLTLIDANRIADESQEYLELQRTIIETNNIEELLNSKSIFPEEDKNLLFDLISFGKTSDFKMQIIESFVLESLFQNRQASIEELILSCNAKFQSKENTAFYEKLAGRLLTAKKIIKLPGDSNIFKLSSAEEKKISALKEQYALDESHFLNGISNILKKYKQEHDLDNFVAHLKDIYIKNFNVDLNSLLENEETNDVGILSREFLNFVNNKLKSPQEGKKLSLELFNYCRDNNFIQKFCAGKAFSENTNLTKLERYVQTQKRIFIDTQISLFGLCYFYEPKNAYQNYFYKVCKNLLELARASGFQLFLPDKYLHETSNHLREAFNLAPFTRLPNFTKLGKSRNVFYNFYLYYITQDNIEEIDFVSFLEKFNLRAHDKMEVYDRILKSYLNKIGIITTTIEKSYDIKEVADLIEWELDKVNKFRPRYNINNDATVFEFLSDNDVTVHPLQPVFLTWDKNFFKVQSVYYRNNPEAQRWFLLTPGRFADHYSLLKFKIGSEILTSEILALLSDDIVSTTHSLLDSIATILNPNDEVGLEYTNRLSQIRDNEIHALEENELILPEDFEGEAVIDDVFYKLTAHFRQDRGRKLEAFKKVFTEKSLVEPVILILSNAVTDFYKQKHFDEKIYERFENLFKFL